jgi:integrase
MKALHGRFGSMPAGNITIEDCRAHTAERRKSGIKDGTIATELGRLRMVLRWAQKRGLLGVAPAIERPSPPKRRDRHLTREQCRALIDAATLPHVKLYIVLALATAARNSALLDLTWDRCNFDSGLIDLRNPEINRPHKGRAMVPMNRSLRAALLEARAGALSAHVIEWAGERVGSVKRGLKSAARAAGIREAVSPHLLRHSAAVHMIEAGISISEIAQYLGHENERITAQVYSRYSPQYLRQAAAVLEYDDIAEQRRKA